MFRHTPPLLQPYFSLQPGNSFVVVTSVLGACANWLLLRYLHAIIRGPHRPAPPNDPDAAVVLVSFMRDFSFWDDGARRLHLDLEPAARRGRFVFVDGLSALFLPAGLGQTRYLPPWQVRLASARAEDVGAALHAAVDGLVAQGASRVVLLFDGLDLLLATAGNGNGCAGMGARIKQMVMGLQQRTYATVMAFSSDAPLVANQVTTLEREHASLVTSVIHEAHMILGLRLLDTGAARDVSGAISITRGAGGWGGGSFSTTAEYRYHVQGDGGVRAFTSLS